MELKKMRSAALALVAIIVVAADVGAQHVAVDSLVAAEALDRGVPAVAVAIVADGRVVVQRAWGVVDAETRRAATAATPFNIASVTKPFTAAVVLQLVAEGAVALDDPVINHLPSLPYPYAEITVRQLLTHTSGIARDLRLDNFDDPDRATYEARLDTASASAPPGQRFEYSNTGYTVLGWLVSEVEGAPLADVLSRRLFEPLGMTQARYRAPLADDPLRALPHELENGEPRPADYISGGFGSGGISMSAADAVAFALALQDGRFLPASLADTAWTPARLGDGTDVDLQMFGQPASYGFGWFLARYADRPMMTHGGGIEGYSANLYHFPEERLTIVVLANTKGRDDGTAPVDPLARRLADLCLERDGCRPAPEEARLRSTVTTANQAFSRAYLTGDTAAIHQMYTPGALALPPHGRAVSGARAIAALFASPRNSRRVAHALYTERLVPTGAGAVELGTWYDRWETGAGDEGAATGRYILTWVRDGDAWKIATDAWVPVRTSFIHATAPAQETNPAEAAVLLSYHEVVLRAHRDDDLAGWLAIEADDYVVANRGRISFPTLDERRAARRPYLESTRFTRYEDLREPIVRVSEDGSLGWVIAEVVASGVQITPDGSEEPIEFVSAWIELYRKIDGEWRLVGNVSNFR